MTRLVTRDIIRSWIPSQIGVCAAGGTEFINSITVFCFRRWAKTFAAPMDLGYSRQRALSSRCLPQMGEEAVPKSSPRHHASIQFARFICFCFPQMGEEAAL
jgi:hypothetical protein